MVGETDFGIFGWVSLHSFFRMGLAGSFSRLGSAEAVGREASTVSPTYAVGLSTVGVSSVR